MPADQPERDPPIVARRIARLDERSGQHGKQPDRDDGDQRERPGDQGEGNGREQLPVLVLEGRQTSDSRETATDLRTSAGSTRASFTS